MQHCLAYGNSDQASFRHPEVEACFDVLTVPATIATYYPDATAAFVLSSGLEYMIEPRTPLFQEELREPRASHYSLAEVMGSSVRSQLGEPNADGPNPPAYFPSSFYSESVCEEVVSGVVEFQRQYGSRSEQVATRLDRYRRLLDLAKGGSGHVSETDESRGPKYVLCPYFAVSTLNDDWWEVMNRIWATTQQLDHPRQLSPVVTIANVSLLGEALEHVPDNLSPRVFFWIPGFNEREVSVMHLRLLRDMVATNSEVFDLMNLYGGYFSILLGKVGLSGFNNGLGYSESRNWPTLDATGAAPARYYVRRLHAYLPTAAATALVDVDDSFACDCSACEGGFRRPNELNYHELKRHFALARAWELQMSEAADLESLCDDLRQWSERVELARRRLPSSLRIPSAHLARWAQALG